MSKIQTKSVKPTTPLGVVDALTLARLARVNIGTFNVWAHRGLLPGLVTGVRGRRRDIAPDVATRILTFAELVRFGFSPEDVSRMVAAMTDLLAQEGFLVVPRAAPGEDGVGSLGVAGAIIHVRDPAGIATATARLPPIYLVVNVRELTRRVAAAQAEWLQRREAKN